jgi:hypothetical protein
MSNPDLANVLSLRSRKGVTDQAQEKLTPDSQKSGVDQAKEKATGVYDKAAGAVQPGEWIYMPCSSSPTISPTQAVECKGSITNTFNA